MYCYYSIPHTVICLLSSSQKSNRFLAISIRYLKECALTYINMSIIEKVFKYEANELSVINHIDGMWFRGKTVAEILKYTNQ